MTEEDSHSPRGYYGIGFFRPQHPVNVGTVIRAAACFDADYVCTIGGERYKGKASDVGHSKHLPVFHFGSWNDMITSVPESEIVLIDYDDSAYPIENFYHSERALYVVGSEGNGFTEKVLKRGYRKVYIDSEFCLNSAMASNIVLRERYMDDED